MVVPSVDDIQHKVRNEGWIDHRRLLLYRKGYLEELMKMFLSRLFCCMIELVLQKQRTSVLNDVAYYIA